MNPCSNLYLFSQMPQGMKGILCMIKVRLGLLKSICRALTDNKHRMLVATYVWCLSRPLLYGQTLKATRAPSGILPQALLALLFLYYAGIRPSTVQILGQPGVMGNWCCRSCELSTIVMWCPKYQASPRRSWMTRRSLRMVVSTSDLGRAASLTS